MRTFLAVMAAVVLLAGATAPAATAATHPTTYYLSLGDSLAAGQQPTGDPADMYRTNQGYADRLYQIARLSRPGLELVKLGCPGETTATMMTGRICKYAHGSQLAEAVAFLEAHGRSVAFVTIDIGWNDFACQTGLECIPPGVATIGQNLPTILATLQAATAPGVPIVGATLYDPFLAFWLAGPAGQALAKVSVTDAIVPINTFVRSIYEQFGMSVADVQGVFLTTRFTPLVPLPGYGKVPLNVATICALTWICAPPPLGPDNHANSAGYFVMALAFARALHR